MEKCFPFDVEINKLGQQKKNMKSTSSGKWWCVLDAISYWGAFVCWVARCVKVACRRIPHKSTINLPLGTLRFPIHEQSPMSFPIAYQENCWKGESRANAPHIFPSPRQCKEILLRQCVLITESCARNRNTTEIPLFYLLQAMCQEIKLHACVWFRERVERARDR